MVINGWFTYGMDFWSTIYVYCVFLHDKWCVSSFVSIEWNIQCKYVIASSTIGSWWRASYYGTKGLISAVLVHVSDDFCVLSDHHHVCVGIQLCSLIITIQDLFCQIIIFCCYHSNVNYNR